MNTKSDGFMRIGIVMGDPSGIGPEVALKAIRFVDWNANSCPVLIGSRDVFQREINKLNLPTHLSCEENSASPDGVRLVESVREEVNRFPYGKPSKQSGQASYNSILMAVELAASGSLDAIVTSPISKSAFGLAGVEFPGHTELLAQLTKAPRYAMMLAAGKLKVTLVTTHMALSQVGRQITAGTVFDKIELSAIFLSHYLKLQSPTIGVCALNPHAGEGGKFGTEEKEIAEAVRDANNSGIKAEGPLPADSLFAHWQKYDCVVSCYHDQGLIPVKMLAFDTAVNVTLGLPIVRTSPDHGTAFDIAGEGKANPDSMIEAIKLARKMVLAGRVEWKRKK